MTLLHELENYQIFAKCFVIHKPFGWSVHNEEPSLHTFLKKSFHSIHFVNRIDRETSGLVVWTEDAHQVEYLQNLLAHPETHKIYRALTSRPRELKLRTWVWDQTLTNQAEGRENPFGHPQKRVTARTEVEILNENKWFLDLMLEIKTGRQHQIRKHCAGHNFPIIGDQRYGRHSLNQKIRETYNEERLFLHAWRLETSVKDLNLHVEALLPQAFTNLISPT